MVDFRRSHFVSIIRRRWVFKSLSTRSSLKLLEFVGEFSSFIPAIFSAQFLYLQSVLRNWKTIISLTITCHSISVFQANFWKMKPCSATETTSGTGHHDTDKSITFKRSPIPGLLTKCFISSRGICVVWIWVSLVFWLALRESTILHTKPSNKMYIFTVQKTENRRYILSKKCKTGWKKTWNNIFDDE